MFVDEMYGNIELPTLGHITAVNANVMHYAKPFQLDPDSNRYTIWFLCPEKVLKVKSDDPCFHDLLNCGMPTYSDLAAKHIVLLCSLNGSP